MCYNVGCPRFPSSYSCLGRAPANFRWRTVSVFLVQLMTRSELWHWSSKYKIPLNISVCFVMYWNVMIISSNLLRISIESYCGTRGFPFCCSHRRSSQKNLFSHQSPYNSSLHVSSGEYSGRGQNYPLAIQMASMRHGSEYSEDLPRVNVLSRSPHGNSMGM